MALKAVLEARPNILVTWGRDGIYDQTLKTADALKRRGEIEEFALAARN